MRVLIKILVIASCMLLSFAIHAAEKSPRPFAKIIESGQLKVAIALSPPWVMRAKEGQLVGAEIDMARRLAADMGLSVEFGLYQQENLISALEQGEVDIVVSAMTISPSRALRVNFSRPYGDMGIGLATNTKLTSAMKSLNELQQSSVTIAVIDGSIAADVASRLFAKASIKTVASKQAAERALVAGDVHAVIAAGPQPTHWSLQHPAKIDLPLAKPLLSFKQGMAINKGDIDFLNFLDAWIVARSSDGWISSTRHYWLETLEWQE